MNATPRVALRPVHRVLFLAIFVSMAWCAISLATAASSASAAQTEGNGSSGLLGAVGSLVNEVGDTAAGANEVVDDAAASLAPVAEPVAALAPVPVETVATEAVRTVDTTVRGADAAVVETIEATLAPVSAAADSGLVGDVVGPLVGAVSEVPVVGGLVEQVGVDDVLVDVASGVDGAVSAIVGTSAPIDPILPSVPEIPGAPGLPDAPRAPHPTVAETVEESDAPPAETAPSSPQVAFSSGLPAVIPEVTAAERRKVESVSRMVLMGQRISRAESSPVDAGVSLSLGTPPVDDAGRDERPPGEPLAIAPASPASAVGGSGGASTMPGIAGVDPRTPRSAFSTVHTAANDALPGAPVFDTDVAPD